VTDGVYVADGDRLIPGPGATGPWFPGVQHGGAVLGLFARAVEATPAAGPMMLTRLTVDMSRRVPMAPTRVDTEVVRDGRRVQALELRLDVNGETVARATAMRVRIDATVVPADKVTAWPEDAMPPGPDDTPVMTGDWSAADFIDNFTMRRIETDPGRARTWLRMHVPLVDGETTSPTVLAAIVADMIPSAGTIVDFDDYLSVNPDLSVHLHRPPQGEWIGHTALVRVSPDGYGQTDAQLCDRNGAFGRSLKSLLIDRR